MSSQSKVRAIILAAGRGSRLGELTQDRPKCLLELGGQSLLEWQLEALEAAGIAEIVVIVGFNARRVEARLEDRGNVTTLHNPFYEVSDNLASLWFARDYFEGDVLVLNGDTLVSAESVRRLVERGAAPINVMIDRKPAYDADDMKVLLDGNRIRAIGKTLTDADAESIGMLLFRGDGTGLFRQTIKEMMYETSSLGRWFLSVIDQLARKSDVCAVDVAGEGWAEVDFPADIVIAEALVATWKRRSGERALAT
ncbi:phosphocholine cytidylyltransferase family protein [Sphingomonas sp. BIUV-7]|uniref:Phosphocholine cytidylyltransferase family protein n=1 Tax=Sphingomonas natans TaxID=3063330 RepID=A0ABT8YB27_9SPHN|nr:phosphocholine cytidylyltransferase family protein [Sphingomonas sp. BIUV-7]MDO6414914.1 phosphocholine cytidylyltransferase family protein [Sphingomonas sp. BIUV-7]